MTRAIDPELSRFPVRNELGLSHERAGRVVLTFQKRLKLVGSRHIN